MAEINNSVLSTNANKNRLPAVPKLIPDSIIVCRNRNRKKTRSK